MVVILTFGRRRQLTIIKYGACPGQDYPNAFSRNHSQEELIWPMKKCFVFRPKSVRISSIILITVSIHNIAKVQRQRIFVVGICSSVAGQTWFPRRQYHRAVRIWWQMLEDFVLHWCQGRNQTRQNLYQSCQSLKRTRLHPSFLQ